MANVAISSSAVHKKDAKELTFFNKFVLLFTKGKLNVRVTV